MKPNVDLTMNRDFAKRDSNGNAATALGRIAADIRAVLHGQHPRIPWLSSDWREVESDYDLHVGEPSNLMFMGNKEDRAKKKFYDSEYDESVCYCCGTKIKIPWKNRARLCPRCESGGGKDRVLWRE